MSADEIPYLENHDKRDYLLPAWVARRVLEVLKDGEFHNISVTWKEPNREWRRYYLDGERIYRDA